MKLSQWVEDNIVEAAEHYVNCRPGKGTISREIPANSPVDLSTAIKVVCRGPKRAKDTITFSLECAGIAISTISFSGHGDTYDLYDRKVKDPSLRALGWGSLNLKIAERFFQVVAGQKTITQGINLEIDAGQTHLFRWAEKNNYQPASAVDQLKMELFTRLKQAGAIATTPEDYLTDDSNKHILQLAPPDVITSMRSRHNVFRVKFSKKVTPRISRPD